MTRIWRCLWKRTDDSTISFGVEFYHEVWEGDWWTCTISFYIWALVFATRDRGSERVNHDYGDTEDESETESEDEEGHSDSAFV